MFQPVPDVTDKLDSERFSNPIKVTELKDSNLISLAIRVCSRTQGPVRFIELINIDCPIRAYYLQGTRVKLNQVIKPD